MNGLYICVCGVSYTAYVIYPTFFYSFTNALDFTAWFDGRLFGFSWREGDVYEDAPKTSPFSV